MLLPISLSLSLLLTLANSQTTSSWGEPFTVDGPSPVPPATAPTLQDSVTPTIVPPSPSPSPSDELSGITSGEAVSSTPVVTSGTVSVSLQINSTTTAGVTGNASSTFSISIPSESPGAAPIVYRNVGVVGLIAGAIGAVAVLN